MSLPGGVTLSIRPTQSGAAQDVFSLPNLHGDNMATTDATGSLSGQYWYDPFGSVINPAATSLPTTFVKNPGSNTATFPDYMTPTNSQTSTSPNPYGTTMAYKGQADKWTETSFYLTPIQMGARTYIPLLGRFTSMDPISGGNANAYVYSVDPINSQDVSGRFSISWSSVVNAVEHVVNTVSNALTVLHTWEDVHPRLTFVISVLATGSSGGASEDEGIDLQGSRDFVGRRGSPLVPHDQVDSLGNRPTVIEDRLYKGHALNEMQNGGIYPTVVENTIQNGYEVPSSQAETTRLYDPANGVTAVLNSGGDVITTFYGERMQ